MFNRDADRIVMIYESMNKISFIVEYDKEGNRIHSMMIPYEIGEALRELDPNNRGNLMIQNFLGNDPNFSDISNRKFSVQTYDESDLQYLKDNEDGDVWMSNPADLKNILHRLTTFGDEYGADFNFVKEYFPKLTENGYEWLRGLS